MSNNRWALAAAGLLFCDSSSGVSAASSTVPQVAAPYTIDVWETEDGLPQNSVIAMTQTRDGYLWLGTLKGLVRFDGIRFTVFDESNTPGLESGPIVSLVEDSQGNLWMGTETAGVALLDNGRGKSRGIGRGTREGRLMAVCEDPDRAVWLYTANGQLCRHHNGGDDVWNFGADNFSNCRAKIQDVIPPIVVPAQLTVGSVKPYRAIRVFTDGHQAPLPGPSPNTQAFDPAIVERRHAGRLRSHPEVALTVFKETDNRTALQPGSVALIKHRESNAIETNQAFERPQPEIAVPGLRHGNHGILRQPVFRLPDVNGIGRGNLGYRAGGGTYAGRRVTEQQPCGCESPTVIRHIRLSRWSGIRMDEFDVGPKLSLTWPATRSKRGRASGHGERPTH